MCREGRTTPKLESGVRRDESGAEVTVRRAASPPPAQLEAHLHCPSLPGSRMCGPDEHTQHDVLILLLSNPEYHAQFSGDTALQWKKGHSAAVYNSCVDIKTKTPLWNGKKILHYFIKFPWSMVLGLF